MNRKKIIQIIAILFLGLGIVLLYPSANLDDPTSIFAFISVLSGTLGSIISIFIPSEFVFDFEENTWIKGEKDNSINIEAKKHGMGKSPQIQTFSLKENGFQEVLLNQSSDLKGNVTISATSMFKGKIIIK
ncbi:hypothetical protein [Algoriphagus aquimarinus]|uniref:hypothetical protein n=1 Tax=Algoriphagus aquimarinus TaxID=237018 RepID=UPI0030DD5C1E|tara:strand:- start:63029 stop:63421 length:393 start_codon:yes stop_codon:yes gene_type:complete